MARPLGYTPPTPPDTRAADELHDLVDALHDSGLLRAVAGAARSYPRLLRQVLDVTDPATVRSVLELGRAAGGLDPDASARLARGVRRARTDAAAAAAGPAEGPLRLLRRLRDPDTRRGLSAALAAMTALGAALAVEEPARQKAGERAGEEGREEGLPDATGRASG